MKKQIVKVPVVHRVKTHRVRAAKKSINHQTRKVEAKAKATIEAKKNVKRLVGKQNFKKLAPKTSFKTKAIIKKAIALKNAKVAKKANLKKIIIKPHGDKAKSEMQERMDKIQEKIKINQQKAAEGRKEEILAAKKKAEEIMAKKEAKAKAAGWAKATRAKKVPVTKAMKKRQHKVVKKAAKKSILLHALSKVHTTKPKIVNILPNNKPKLVAQKKLHRSVTIRKVHVPKIARKVTPKPKVQKVVRKPKVVVKKSKKIRSPRSAKRQAVKKATQKAILLKAISKVPGEKHHVKKSARVAVKPQVKKAVVHKEAGKAKKNLHKM